MPNNELQQRDPFVGPPRRYTGAPAEKVELFAEAVREWGTGPASNESSRCRGVESSGTGDYEPRTGVPNGAQ